MWFSLFDEAIAAPVLITPEFVDAVLEEVALVAVMVGGFLSRNRFSFAPVLVPWVDPAPSKTS